MAKALYTSFLEHMFGVYTLAENHFTVDPVDMYVCGVGAGYTFNPAHTEVEDLGIDVVLPPVAMTDVTYISGLIKASDVETETSEQSGDVATAAVIFIANDDGSRLMAFIDEGEEGQLPITFVSGKLFIRWNPAGIFRI